MMYLVNEEEGGDGTPGAEAGTDPAETPSRALAAHPWDPGLSSGCAWALSGPHRCIPEVGLVENGV